VNIFIGHFSDTSTPTAGNESLNEISNDSAIREINTAASRNLITKSTMFPHRNNHKLAGRLLVERNTIRSTTYGRQETAFKCTSCANFQGSSL
jgi:hypothetical protein